jgi:hypothetical protein
MSNLSSYWPRTCEEESEHRALKFREEEPVPKRNCELERRGKLDPSPTEIPSCVSLLHDVTCGRNYLKIRAL